MTPFSEIYFLTERSPFLGIKCSHWKPKFSKMNSLTEWPPIPAPYFIILTKWPPIFFVLSLKDPIFFFI